MSRKVFGFLFLAGAGILAIGFFLFSNRTKGVSGLKVDSNPTASVFLNDQLLGKTPLENKFPPGEYVIKLIPEESSSTVSSWQDKVILYPSLLTYVNKDLGSSEVTTGGEKLTLEGIDGNEAQIAVFSTPDAATVIFDGQEKGLAPVFLRDVLPGEHDIAVNLVGFAGRTIRVQATAGYKVIAEFQLAMTEAAQINQNATPSAQIGEAPAEGSQYVKISETPTGFLRVRSSPSTAATEITQVKPGDKYPYSEEKEGWYKITYEEGKEGWVSGRYAEKVE